MTFIDAKHHLAFAIKELGKQHRPDPALMAICQSLLAIVDGLEVLLPNRARDITAETSEISGEVVPFEIDQTRQSQMIESHENKE